MKEEIGGYFELDYYGKGEYHKNGIGVNLARNALIYIIKSKKIKTLYVPYFLCDSVKTASEFCNVIYYKINKYFLPDFDKSLGKNDYIYIVNYFGMFSNLQINKLKLEYKNIIIDNVQAFFQMPCDGVDTIYSCRKFFGVPDGAYVYTDSIINEKLEKDFSLNRVKHILGRCEENASKYYDEYRKNEELFESLPLKQMSNITKTILSGIDYKLVKKKRTDNFKYLNENLRNINLLKIKNISGAFAYPLYIKNAKKIRQNLIKNKVYIPVLWPNVIEDNKDNVAYEYASNILVLPCDQRYGLEEMKKIVKIIKECC